MIQGASKRASNDILHVLIDQANGGSVNAVLAR